MKTNKFTSKMTYDFSPRKYLSCEENKYGLNLVLELEQESLKNYPDERFYFAYFEEHPLDKFQITSKCFKNAFDKVVRETISELTKLVSKYYEGED